VVIHQNERAAQAAEIIAILAERFPAAFVVYARRRKPLKTGIFDDLLTATAGRIPADALKGALQCYTRHFDYLRACREGTARINLDGKPAGVVTEKEAAWAAACAENQRRRRQVAQPPRAQVQPPSAPALAPKRLSLSDLKRAAQARREGAAS
jgi:ProP effector